MKLRTVLYGYHYENGRIMIEPKEFEIVKEIRSMYLNGQSLKCISEDLNRREIEYIPSVIGWNKSRLMRILDEKGYLGNEKYPSTITQEEYDTIQSIKNAKNSQKDLNRQADIFQIEVPVRCPKCGGTMYRKVDSRWAISSRWYCSRERCHTTIGKDDECLLTEITELLNKVIENPSMLEIPVVEDINPSIELRKLNGSIEKMLNSPKIDQEAARKRLIEYASKQYEEIDCSPCQARKTRDIFERATPLERFDGELLSKTVGEIRLYMDGSISLVLENKQEIRGGEYATS